MARRAAGVSVYNIDTLKPVAEISDAKGALAVVIAPGIGSPAGRGFSANGDSGEKSLTVFDQLQDDRQGSARFRARQLGL